MTLAMKALGLSADDEQLRALLMAVKERALSTKALLPFEEVAAMANEHLKGSG
jgi:hypothetical protein